jgi:hypothetical protein
MRVGIEAWGLSGDMRNTGMGEYTAQLLIGLSRHPTVVEVYAYGGPDEPRPAWLPAGVRWGGSVATFPISSARSSRDCAFGLPAEKRRDRRFPFRIRPLAAPVPQVPRPRALAVRFTT